MYPDIDIVFSDNRTSKKFWMVVGDGNNPKVRHPNKHIAVAEADRLANLKPGVVFYVLEATDSVEAVTTIHTKL